MTKPLSSLVYRRLFTCLGRSPRTGFWPVYWISKPWKHISRSTSSTPRRGGETQQDDGDSHPICWSLLSSSPLAICSKLSSIEPRRARIEPGRIPLVIVLVTPAHLSLLENSNAFIPNLLRQEFGRSPPGRLFDVIAAVVDRIPVPSAATQGHKPANDESHPNGSPGTTERDGSEGISVAVLDSDSAAPSLWAQTEEPRERETMTIQQRCTLTFKTPFYSQGYIGIQKHRHRDLLSRTVQLPVANTLFQNGRTATLFAQRWILQQEHGSNVQPVLNQKTWLLQQTLDVGGLAQTEMSVDHSLHSELTPITPTRVITAAIGNIIRRISAGGSQEANSPASEELEKVISSGIKNGSIPAQPAGVWALVKPREHAVLYESSPDRIETESDQLHTAILSGCRLHKVLSGGGGWGEKQGLLALDPDSSYSPRQETLQLDFEDARGAGAAQLQALEEVVKPGDMVTFYVCNPLLTQAKHSASGESLVSISLSFGTLPSTMDAMPSSRPTGKVAPKKSDCVMVKGCFGMLSERGMSLTSTFSKPGVKGMTTKLDAPYTLFTISGSSVSPQNKRINEFDGPDQDLQQTEHSKRQDTFSTNARMFRISQELPKLDFRSAMAPGLQSLYPKPSGCGTVQIRSFTTSGIVRRAYAVGNKRFQRLTRKLRGARDRDLIPDVKRKKGIESPLQNRKDAVEAIAAEGSGEVARKDQTDSASRIRFISYLRDEDSHLYSFNEPESLWEHGTERNQRPIKVRRHLSIGKASKSRLDQALEIDTANVRPKPLLGETSSSSKMRKDKTCLENILSKAKNKHAGEAEVRSSFNVGDEGLSSAKETFEAFDEDRPNTAGWSRGPRLDAANNPYNSTITPEGSYYIRRYRTSDRTPRDKAVDKLLASQDMAADKTTITPEGGFRIRKQFLRNRVQNMAKSWSGPIRIRKHFLSDRVQKMANQRSSQLRIQQTDNNISLSPRDQAIALHSRYRLPTFTE